MLKYFLILSLILLISAKDDDCKKPRKCHVDPEEPQGCEEKIHSVAIVLSPGICYSLINSETTIEISYPNWLYYDNIGGINPVALALVDKLEQMKVEVIDTKFIRSQIPGKTILSIDLNYLQKKLLNEFINNAKPGSNITISFNMILGNLHLLSKDNCVYENFNVNVNVFCNGLSIIEYQFETNIAYLMTSYLYSTFLELPDTSFSGNPEQIRNAMFNMLDALESMINAKNPKGAYEKLKKDIMAKFDGQNDGNPQDDWIIDQWWATNLFAEYQKIENLINYLR